MGFTKENIMVHTRFEVTILEPLIDIEALGLTMAAENKSWDINIVSSGRIIVIEGPKTIKPIIKFLAFMGLADDVGLIKKIVEYEPDDYAKEFVEYNQNEL